MQQLSRGYLDKFHMQSRLYWDTFFSALVTEKDLSTIDSFKIGPNNYFRNGDMDSKHPIFSLVQPNKKVILNVY